MSDMNENKNINPENVNNTQSEVDSTERNPIQNNGYSAGTTNNNYVPQNQYYYPQANNYPQQSSYTWGQPQYYPQQIPQTYLTQTNKKKSGKGIGLKLLALLLCCIISTSSTIAVIGTLLYTGIVKLPGSSDSTYNNSFTITRIVDNSEYTEESDTGKLSRKEIAAKLIPSVVCIQNYQQVRYSNYYGDFFSDFFGFGGSPFGYSDNNGGDDSELTLAGEGSGIIISEDGYIATNAHVVDGSQALKVITSDGGTYEAELVGSDAVTDLAVVKITADNLVAAEFGSAEDLAVGDEVVAVGNPGGYEFNSSVTVGCISALNREIISGDDGYSMYCIQTDAAINPGNSGGALVNEYGQVIGINSSKIVANGYEGLGFAIPSNTAQPIINDLINFGYVKFRAILGISGQFVDSMTAEWYGLSTGMYVSSVNTDEAKESGLQKGDVIVSINGVEITSSTTVTSVVSKLKPGDTVEVVVNRNITDEHGISLSVVLSQYIVEDNEEITVK